MITERQDLPSDKVSARQGKILISLIEKYIGRAQPISSQLLKKECGLDVCPATIRNDLRELMEKGYITQPYTSAGRVPTDKAYRYFAKKIYEKNQSNFSKFILNEIRQAQQKIQEELSLVLKLENYLSAVSLSLEGDFLEENNFLQVITIIGPSKNAHSKNINLINELIREMEKL